MTMQGSQHSFAGPHDKPSGPIEVIHPSGDGLPPGSCHYTGPHDGHGEALGFVDEDRLCEGFGECVGIGSVAY